MGKAHKNEIGSPFGSAPTDHHRDDDVADHDDSVREPKAPAVTIRDAR